MSMSTKDAVVEMRAGVLCLVTGNDAGLGTISK